MRCPGKPCTATSGVSRPVPARIRFDPGQAALARLCPGLSGTVVVKPSARLLRKLRAEHMQHRFRLQDTDRLFQPPFPPSYSLPRGSEP